jgi:hypothetical protein
MGMRNFLLFTPPPIDMMPSASLPSQGGYRDRNLTKALNGDLTSQIRRLPEQFEKKHPDVNLFFFHQDYYMRLIAQWPELFGVSDPARFAVKIGDHYRDRGQMGLLYVTFRLVFMYNGSWTGKNLTIHRWDDFYGHQSGLIAR